MEKQFKTKTDNGHRIFEGILKVCSSDEGKNYKVRLMLLNGKRNRNGWVYENIEKNLEQFNGIPILYSVINGKVGNSHDFEIFVDEKTGEKYASFIGAESEHPYGWIPETIDGKPNAHMENIDGVDWVVAEGVLPTYYNREMIDELEANGGQKQISIETLVSKYRIQGNTEYEEEWTVTGVTILSVREAVAGANIRKLSESIGELEEIKLRVASYYEPKDNKNEPQTQNKKSKKGVVRTMKVEELKKSFPDFTVLAVNAEKVALLDKDGVPHLASVSEDGDKIVAGKIEAVRANAAFGDEANAFDVSVEEITGSLVRRCSELEAELAAEKTSRETVEKSLRAMQNAETERRKEAIKTAVKSRLAENNANCADDERVEDNACDELISEAKVNEYLEMVDKDGKFVGEERAKNDVDAICMNALNEARKARATAHKKGFSWAEMLKENAENSEAKSGVSAAMERMLKNADKI